MLINLKNYIDEIITEDNVVAKITRVEILNKDDGLFRVHFKLLNGEHKFAVVYDDMRCDENKLYGFKFKPLLRGIGATQNITQSSIELEELLLNKKVILNLSVYEKTTERGTTYKRQKVNYHYYQANILENFVEEPEPRDIPDLNEIDTDMPF